MGLRRVLYFLLLIASAALTACSPQIITTTTSSASTSSFIIDPSTIVAEKDYSSSTTTYTGTTVTINATLQYQRFDDASGSGGTPSTLTTKSLNPIRLAEVVIYDVATGAVVQTGQTNASGQIQPTSGSGTGLIIPRPSSTKTYKLQVNSRAFNSKIKASVLADPQSNNFYSISNTFTVGSLDTTVSVTVSAATASYNTGAGQNLEGGAFNILDQVYVANEYLRSNSGNSSLVADKIQIFWKPGFDPGTGYVGASSTVSFFLSAYYLGLARGLYIVGGTSGSVCGDTDHFDRSIILHEYGHYLEDLYAGSDSPGGTHYGTTLIDPRLAWSEGWANFFQGASLSRPYYWDTSGNSDCSGTPIAMIKYSLRAQSNSNEPYNAGQGVTVTDVPNSSVDGEGTFREFSISRTLFKAITDGTMNPDGNWSNISFSNVWTAFTSMYSTGKFRNAGLMMKALQAQVNTNENSKLTSFNTVLANDKQTASQSYYSVPMVNTAAETSSCIGTVSNSFPRSTASDTPTTSSNSSALRRSSRYFLYTYDGTAANATIKIKYRKKSGDAFSSPFDLTATAYSYKYDLTSSSTGAVVSSAGTYPENSGDASYPGLETISLSGQAAGTYMIRVQVAGSLTTRAETQFIVYNSTSGVWLCPNP
jgi:hypothetical protein